MMTSTFTAIANRLHSINTAFELGLKTAKKVPLLSDTHFLPSNSTIIEGEAKGKVDKASARSLSSSERIDF